MATFVQLKDEWLNLDHVVRVRRCDSTIEVDDIAGGRNHYGGEDACLLLEVLKPFDPFFGIAGGRPLESVEGSIGGAISELLSGQIGSKKLGEDDGVTHDGREPLLRVVEAGVDPNHQTEQCDHCKKALTDDEVIQTNDGYHYLTLCRGCYGKAGNSVC